MHSAIASMLEKYKAVTNADYKNALKEIIQEIALMGLAKSNFFDRAAFYGGTALRIFYGAERFSEDLDFSLLEKDNNFDLNRYCETLREELAAYGFDVNVTKKEKTGDSTIESAFIKGNTRVHLLKIEAINPPVSGIDEKELLKIKLEVDTDPPQGAIYEMKYLLTPLPFSVRLFSKEDLFAGKVHALLCRNWGGDRVKGRDLYDFVWYLSKKIFLHTAHLEQRMIQSGHWDSNDKLTKENLTEQLGNKFASIRYEQAQKDVMPFIKNPEELRFWSKEFFNTITKEQLLIN